MLCFTICAFLLAELAPGAAAARILDSSEEVLNADKGDQRSLSTDTHVEALVEMLLRKENAELNIHDEKQFRMNCQWPAELKAKYTDQYEVGKGATACVYLAKDTEGKPVAVKLSKSANKLESWKKECRKMQNVHLNACKIGPEALGLMETYIPTCLEVGGTSNEPYYVMHAAGTQRIGKTAKKLSQEDQVKVFSQLVAALYALHSQGWGHNDLHGGNVVLDGSRLSLIDFGSLRPLDTSKTRNSKRDGNRLWEHAAAVGHCGKDSQWDRHAQNNDLQKRATKLKECLKKGWSVDDNFITALDKVLQADISSEKNQHLTELFQTKFVQDHLPAVDNHFQWLAADTCKPIKGSVA